MSRPRQGSTQVKTTKTRELETQSKIKRLRARLDEIAEYKKVLATDGSKPDIDDKRLESELIVRLLSLEKELKNMAPEALALKARMREEEAARGTPVDAPATLKRRVKANTGRRQISPKPSVVDLGGSTRSPRVEGAAVKKAAPRGEPWRSPYGEKKGGDRASSHRKEGPASVARQPRAAKGPMADDLSRAAASGPARHGGKKRPSPYAARPGAKKEAGPRGAKRPTPASTRTSKPAKDQPRDESGAPKSTSEKKKGYWSRDDRRVRPAKSGRAPAPRR